MEDNLEQRLLAAITKGRHRNDIARQYQNVERLIAEAVGGQQNDLKPNLRGPDILISRPNDTPIAIEVKLFSGKYFQKTLDSRVADLLTNAIETHHSYRGKVTQSAVIVVSVEEPVEALDYLKRIESSLSRRLLRTPDGIGYDSLLFGIAESQLSWYYLSTAANDHTGFSRVLRSAEAMEHLHRQRNLFQRSQIREPAGRKQRFLLVADEWKSGRGGLSTVNRELAIALAQTGVETAVLVPQAFEADIIAGSNANVAVVAPAQIPGLTARESLLLRPVFAEQSWQPDVVIGHGRLLGPYAAAQQQQFFPEARRVHFVHTDAEQLEAAKEEPGGNSNMLSANVRRLLERDLAQSADLVVGVGPLLAETMNDELISATTNPKVICLVPGLRQAFDVSSSSPPVKNKILIVGRADDFKSKGIDIAAEALLRITDQWPPSRQHSPTLVIRGIPDQAEDDVKRQLEDIFGDRVPYTLRPYSESENDVLEDISQARMLLMPSRHEGFGLAAYEAIASGVPVLISAESGLAQFLQQSAIDTFPSSIVTTRNTSTQLYIDKWVEAIQRILDAPEHARTQAIHLRTEIKNKVTWKKSVSALIKELDSQL